MRKQASLLSSTGVDECDALTFQEPKLATIADSFDGIVPHCDDSLESVKVVDTKKQAAAKPDVETWFEQRFGHLPSEDPDHFQEWVVRWNSDDPREFMDAESQAIYNAMLENMRIAGATLLKLEGITFHKDTPIKTAYISVSQSMLQKKSLEEFVEDSLVEVVSEKFGKSVATINIVTAINESPLDQSVIKYYASLPEDQLELHADAGGGVFYEIYSCESSERGDVYFFLKTPTGWKRFLVVYWMDYSGAYYTPATRHSPEERMGGECVREDIYEITGQEANTATEEDKVILSSAMEKVKDIVVDSCNKQKGHEVASEAYGE